MRVGSHVAPPPFPTAWVGKESLCQLILFTAVVGFKSSPLPLSTSIINTIFIIYLASGIPLSAKKEVCLISLSLFLAIIYFIKLLE